MLKNINEMKQKRAELVKEARLMLDTAENEKRDMTAEEDQQYERIWSDIEKSGAEIQQKERELARKEELKKLEEQGKESQGQKRPSRRAGAI